MIDSTKVVSNEQTMNFNLSTKDIEGLLSHVNKLKAEQQRIKNLKTFIRQPKRICLTHPIYLLKTMKTSR